MDERGALAQIHERLDAGEDPAVLVEECRTGMERVGRLYEDGTYYISALIMAGEIIREATELLIPRLTAARQRRPAAARWSSPPCAATSTTSARTS